MYRHKKTCLITAGFFEFGRGSRTRTLTNGFGDRHATITPILYICLISQDDAKDNIAHRSIQSLSVRLHISKPFIRSLCIKSSNYFVLTCDQQCYSTQSQSANKAILKHRVHLD